MADEVLARVGASAPRRLAGVGMLGFIGVFALYVVAAGSPTAGWTVFLVATGAGALALAMRMWQATQNEIELTIEGLRSTDGTEIARLDQIEAMDRGFLAFKPSNGFVLRMSAAQARSWHPGLWWRMGRRVGIGGVTPGAQSKAMSEILAALLAKRDM
ncbi:hypothetical protein [Epibacterium ulvae]|uniref:hypothetical protein n=1 Tax=Epibacterium ulvae TaxID=1156985 RepID=UPI0024903713|nr:hypothetical protein [Epibacterium ulvae]